jgi:glycerol-3-phosphate dehydrogenase
MPPRAHLALPSPGTRRAVVVGAGSFGTAVAVLLARGGFRTRFGSAVALARWRQQTKARFSRRRALS